MSAAGRQVLCALLLLVSPPCSEVVHQVVRRGAWQLDLLWILPHFAILTFMVHAMLPDQSVFCASEADLL